MGITDEELALEGDVDDAASVAQIALAPFSLEVQERSLIRLLARVQRQRAASSPRPQPPLPGPMPRPWRPAAPPPKPPIIFRPGHSVGAAGRQGAVSPHSSEALPAPASTDEEAGGKPKVWKLYDQLVARPQSTIGEYAVGLYGEDSEQTRGKIRSLLDQLKRKQLARSLRPGVWEPIPAPTEESGEGEEDPEENDEE